MHCEGQQWFFEGKNTSRCQKDWNDYNLGAFLRTTIQSANKVSEEIEKSARK